MDEPDGSGNETLTGNVATEAFKTTIVDFKQPATLVGQNLDGRFLIEKNLTDGGADAGGIGVVYLAKDTKLMGKEVVVKILQEAALKNEDIVRKFLHEKEALIRLDHPGIVRILDSGTLTDGNPFMVMEFIEGHSLRKVMRTNGKLPLDVAAHLIESITDALAAAHSKKILHRDIKPENMMLTPQEEGFDRVRLIDFGIARVGESQLAPATEISRPIGTVLYIAPEQLLGRLDLTPAADIYAAAIVAYEMLTGERPFKPESIAEMYLLEKEGVKTPPSHLRHDLPLAAERMILSALEFEPEKRPQNARAFGRDLARALRSDGLRTEGRFNKEAEEQFSGLITEEITRDDPSDFTTVKHIALDVPGKKSNGILKWTALTVLILAALAIPAGYVIWSGNSAGTAANQAKSNTASKPLTNTNEPGPRSVETGGNANTTDSGPERELSYFLMVQKMRNGKPFEAPFKSSGQETYESGYKFNMTFQPDADGYMYVFNEGKDAQGKSGYNLLFPTPNINNGSAQVSKGQQIETARNTFTGARGTEVMWMIWTKQKRDDLEAVTRSAGLMLGAVKDESSAGVLQSFLQKYKAEKPASTKDTANQRTLVRAKGDIVVHRLELEHR